MRLLNSSQWRRSTRSICQLCLACTCVVQQGECAAPWSVLFNDTASRGCAWNSFLPLWTLGVCSVARHNLPRPLPRPSIRSPPLLVMLKRVPMLLSLACALCSRKRLLARSAATQSSLWPLLHMLSLPLHTFLMWKVCTGTWYLPRVQRSKTQQRFPLHLCNRIQ